MADTKLSGLPTVVPTTDDLLYIVDDPAGTPTSKKATIAAVLALGGGGGTITIGTTPIVGGSAGQVLSHSLAGDVVQELATTGAGAVVRAVSPTLTGTINLATTVISAGARFSRGGGGEWDLTSLGNGLAAFGNGGGGVLFVLNYATAGLAKFRNAANTADFDVSARTFLTPPLTVATLPTPIAGMRSMVSDSTVTLTAGIGAVVVGGAANVVPVHYDGTNWRIG